jgi:hypothetical protein
MNTVDNQEMHDGESWKQPTETIDNREKRNAHNKEKIMPFFIDTIERLPCYSYCGLSITFNHNGQVTDVEEFMEITETIEFLVQDP